MVPTRLKVSLVAARALVVINERIQVKNGEGQRRRLPRSTRRLVMELHGHHLDGRSGTIRADHALGAIKRDGTRWEVSHA